jgi:hypothetical protein
MTSCKQFGCIKGWFLASSQPDVLISSCGPYRGKYPCHGSFSTGLIDAFRQPRLRIAVVHAEASCCRLEYQVDCDAIKTKLYDVRMTSEMA